MKRKKIRRPYRLKRRKGKSIIKVGNKKVNLGSYVHQLILQFEKPTRWRVQTWGARKEIDKRLAQTIDRINAQTNPQNNQPKVIPPNLPNIPIA